MGRGHALCDQMIRETERGEDLQYKWILRLRADWTFFAPFPKVDSIPLRENVVLMRSGSDDGFKRTNQNNFNLGASEIMHPFLGREKDMRVLVQALRRSGRGFTPEALAKVWVYDIYGG